ncbi:MAG: amidohydrolase family protein [Vicinamibacterales bacterium]
MTGPPIQGGWVEVAGGHVVAVGAGPAPGAALDLGDVALLPGLVNAHTHLELSWMAGRVPPAASFVAWIRTLMLDRRAHASHDEEAHSEAIRRAAFALRDSGTVLVGDVSNTMTTAQVLREAEIAGVIFHEMVGFNPVDPGAIVRDAWERIDRVIDPGPTLRAGDAWPGDAAGPGDVTACVVAHAPYSVLPTLFPEIVRRHRGGPLSVHVGESAEEVEFLRTGEGPFRALLEELGVSTERWTPPACDPVTYLSRVGYLQPGMLAVHAVQLSDDQLQQLRRAQAVIVTCPRSNSWVGVGAPRLSHFYASGVPVAIGTDSLASTPTLSLFDELAELRRIAPDVAAASLLESATRIGAEALGFGRTFGTIAPGRRAAFARVQVPPGTTDVEEYLVSGVPPSAVQPLWL